MQSKLTLACQAATPGALAQAASCLKAGGLVAFPTETVYGLGADATSAAAVSGIYLAKGRPSFNPLIAHVASLGAAERQGIFSPAAHALAAAFWPGPLTLVVPHSGTVCDLARAGLATVGLRIPGSAVARELISRAGCPIAAPSANRSGHVSPVTAQHVRDDLDGRIDMILDGGPCTVGVESTIIACIDAHPRLLRPGGIHIESIEAVLKLRLADGNTGAVLAPGQLAAHYAPNIRLRLNASATLPDEAVLDFGGQLSHAHAGEHVVMELSPSGNLEEAAANLFAHLRALDACKAQVAAVAPVPDHGLGSAINDRLRRAAYR